ncbi:MAG: GldG family protein [Deltaproteobacteria bacterium]|nr:GldG family protein [Deltaproteobacteria bacterium]
MSGTTQNKLFARGESAIFLVVVTAVLVVLNVLSIGIFYRADLTERRLFSLSDGSHRVASRLRDKMTIRAYFTEDLPPPFNATSRYVRDLLEEYAAASNGRIRLEFVDPTADPTAGENCDTRPITQPCASRDGVNKVAHQVIEREELSMKEGYRGIAFLYLGNTRQIAVVEDTAGLEYEITTILKEMTGERMPVGLLTGHDEPTTEQGHKLLAERAKTYSFRSVDLSGGDREVPREIRALIVSGPTKELNERELRRIDQYLMRGGSVGIFTGNVNVEIEQAPNFTAAEATHGLNRLLEGYGIRINKNLVFDRQCVPLPARGPGGMPVLLPYPAWPVVSFNEQQSAHPVAFRLPQVVMPFASVLSRPRLRASKSVRVTDLMRTTDESWVQSGSYELDPMQRWRPEGRGGPFTLAIAAEGRLRSAFAGRPAAEGGESSESGNIEAPATATKDARLLVVGSSGFADDNILAFLSRMQRSQTPSNLALLLNAVDWLAQDADLVAVRAKEVEDPQVEAPRELRQQMQQANEQEENAQTRRQQREAQQRRTQAEAEWDAKKALYKWGNTFAWPLLFAIFGIVRWRLRLAQRASVKL